jgi:glycosyltransferase involved in cell wall biosynthesis
MAKQERPPRLTVLLVTYEQEDYVAEALNSVMDQDVEGPVEIVVADDASTDGTLEIVSSYQGRDPRFRFRVLDHSINQGITRNYQRAFAACETEYVAVLEGDDYWISPEKLSRQVSFLERHPECPMCAVNYLVYEEPLGRFTPRTDQRSGVRLLTARDQIADNLASNFSTSMYRLSELRRLPPSLFETTSYDWIVNICVARQGPIGFIEEPMSVYRLHPGGAWTGSSRLEQLQAQLDVLADYDAVTEGDFHDEFATLRTRLEETIAGLGEADGPVGAPPPATGTAWRTIKKGLDRLTGANGRDTGSSR